MNDASCPTSEELHALVLGTLSEEAVERVAAHLDVCSRCDETIASFDGTSDDVVAALKRPPLPLPDESDLLYRQATDWARAVGRSWITASLADKSDHEGVSRENSLEGRMLRDYRVTRLLRRGGMGEVYQALHTQLDRNVAIKMLSAYRSNDELLAGRFLREIKTAGKVDHPNIVRASDAGSIDGRLFLVMDLVDGIDGRRLLERRGALPAAEACEIVRQAAEGLQYVHDMGFVHRDVKPANLMITPQGVVKVLDLGLAAIADAAGAEELTDSGQMMGTIEYMAPEQAIDARDAGARADVYSLGATLYAFLTGHAPFAHPPYDTKAKRFLALMHELPRPIAEICAGVSPSLAAVVMQSLERQPDDRFASAGVFAKALEPHAAGACLDALVTDAIAPDVEACPNGSAHTPKVSSAEGKIHASVKDTRLSSGTVSTNAASLLWNRRNVCILAGLAALFALLTIFVVRTPQGTLVIESDDPATEVVVSQEGRNVAVINSEHGWRVRINEGMYDVSLREPGDSFQLSNNSVTVRNGEQTVLTVSRRAVSSATLVDAVQAARDRRWVRLVNVHSGLCLSTHESGFKQGVSLRQQAVREGAVEQHWRLEPTGKPNLFYLVQRKGGLYATLKRAKQGEGLILWPLEDDLAPAQFAFQDVGHGQVKIISEASELALAVWGKDTRENQWIIQWPYNERSADHRWRLVPVADAEEE